MGTAQDSPYPLRRNLIVEKKGKLPLPKSQLLARRLHQVEPRRVGIFRRAAPIYSVSRQKALPADLIQLPQHRRLLPVVGKNLYQTICAVQKITGIAGRTDR